MTDQSGTLTKWAFVTGPPRSGTTMMAALLSRHPSCVILQETHFPLCFAAAFDLAVGRSEGSRSISWREPYGLEGQGWTLPSLLNYGHGDRGLGILRGEAVRALCWAVRAFWPKAVVFGDKSPAYCFHWPLLRFLFPDCYVIVMQRDPEECIDSLYRVGWQRGPREETRVLVERYRAAIADCPEQIAVDFETARDHPTAAVEEVQRRLLAGTQTRER